VVAKSSEWWRGEVGQVSEEEAGEIGSPFWPSGRSGGHRSVLTTVMAAEAEAPTVVSQRAG
jgi:hypothetical protein